jgi:hypothetical protein
MQLKDEYRVEFLSKVDRSCLHHDLKPYVLGLEVSNYWIFDRLAMLMLNYGGAAFIYGASIAVALDPAAPKIKYNRVDE